MTHQIDSKPGLQQINLPENVYRIMLDVWKKKDSDSWIAFSMNLTGCQGEGPTFNCAVNEAKKSAIEIIQSKQVVWYPNEYINKDFKVIGQRVSTYITVLNHNELMEYYSQFGPISCVAELDALNQEYEIGFNYLNPNIKLEDIPTVYCGCKMQILEIGEITAL